MPHKIKVIHKQFLGLEPDLLILHEMVIVQDIYLHVSGFPIWVVQLFFLEIFHPRHKMDIPMCSDFKSNVFCCA